MLLKALSIQDAPLSIYLQSRAYKLAKITTKLPSCYSIQFSVNIYLEQKLDPDIYTPLYFIRDNITWSNGTRSQIAAYQRDMDL